MNLVQSKAGDVFLDTGSQLLMFDGTPLSRPRSADGWPVVSRQDVASLFDWQRDPGRYGSHYVVGTIVNQDNSMFVAGGSIVFIKAWCEEHNATLHLVQAVSDRNEARKRAEARGGVAW